MALQGQQLVRYRSRFSFAAAVVGALLAIIVSPVGAQEIELSKRHQQSGLNSAFTFSGTSFADYVTHSRNMVAAARVDLGGPRSQQIIDANTPFEMKPVAGCAAGRTKAYRRGVVLAHGLTDSPYFMRSLAEIFRDHCFRVMAIVLPGHGTRPGDLLSVTWQEWAKAVAFGVDAMAAEAESIYLMGFSTGGALSVYQSLRDNRVKGLFLFAPAIRISPKGIMANWHEAYSWFAPKTSWVDVLADEDPYKYESFPANAADQIHLLTQQLDHDLRKTKKFMLPVFVAASEDDASVVTSATFDFFRDAIHPLSTFLVYSTRDKVEVEGISSDKLIVIKSVFPEKRVLSSAHTALVLPDSDPQYGANGVYVNCLHYLPKDRERFARCKNRKEDFLGEITDGNLKQGVIRRLTYNTNFNAMRQNLSEFVDRLPSE